MPWIFDARSIDIVFVVDTNTQVVSGSIEFGGESGGDLAIDVGNRDNDTSIVDSGLRVVDGSI